MNAVGLIEFFSSNLYFVTKDENIYLIDNCRLGDSDYNYGIYDVFSKEDLLSGNFDVSNIPNIYVDDYFEFILYDELRTKYRVPTYILDNLSQEPYSDWDIELAKNKITSIPMYLDDVCKIMRCEEKVEGMTSEDIKKHCSYGGDFEMKCIECYQKSILEEEALEEQEYA